MSDTEANKAFNYWSSMRTTMRLMYKSDHVAESTIDNFRAELDDILESTILIYPQTLAQLGMSSKDTLEERKAQLGIEELQITPNEGEQRFLASLAVKADKIRKSNWAWRVSEEAQDRADRGWHAFFVTLTVDPKKANPKEIWTEGREFRKYIRSLVNVVCKELGHPPAHKKTKDFDYRSESDYLTYMGVIEHGKSREHHHGHFLIWMRAIPDSWAICPNKGLRNPATHTKRECKPMQTYWKWSGYCPTTGKCLSPCLYFRTIGDNWESKYNHVLPIAKGKPLKIGNPRFSGLYIIKYLSKEHKEWHHRVKATRNLGMRTLTNLLKRLPINQVEALSWRPINSTTLFSLMKIHTCPKGLIRSAATQRLFAMKHKLNQLDIADLMTSNYGAFTRMLWSVRGGVRPERMDSFHFYDWVGKFLPVSREYCDERLIEAHRILAYHFPIPPPEPEHIKLGANELGHT